jgi:hypothetical protein
MVNLWFREQHLDLVAPVSNQARNGIDILVDGDRASTNALPDRLLG